MGRTNNMPQQAETSVADKGWARGRAYLSRGFCRTKTSKFGCRRIFSACHRHLPPTQSRFSDRDGPEFRAGSEGDEREEASRSRCRPAPVPRPLACLRLPIHLGRHCSFSRCHYLSSLPSDQNTWDLLVGEAAECYRDPEKSLSDHRPDQVERRTSCFALFQTSLVSFLCTFAISSKATNELSPGRNGRNGKGVSRKVISRAQRRRKRYRSGMMPDWWLAYMLQRTWHGMTCGHGVDMESTWTWTW